MVDRVLIRAVALVALLLALPAIVSAQAPDVGNEPSKWDYTFPLWGDKLAQRGLKFPLPFGIGLNYAFIDQPIDISRIAVGVNDGEMVDLSDLIVFDELNSRVHALNLRFDLWLLPFLNVYLMGNYAIDSNTSVSISEPFSFDAGATQSGYGGGFGFTLAGGAWGFFGTLDLNWTWNKLQKLDIPVGTFLLTPRVGKNFGKLGGIEWIFWVGAMRQVIDSETRGEISLSDAVGGDGGFQDKLDDWYEGLPPGRQAVVREVVERIQAGGDPVIHYDLDKAVAYTWNMLIGTEIGITPEWRIRAEVGFIHRTQVIVGLNYRFGGFTSGATVP
ncbi:MAG TPA: hypothetical protein VJV78_37510 [Polyangiales bacterium]|nr:hypothetical protein [Polyangiales bacterium]